MSTLLNWQTKPFADLSITELYRILSLRQEVFIVEQDCPYLDADGKDADCFHLMGYNTSGELVAYARLIPEGISYPNETSIGRILTAESVRGTGAGKELMTMALQHMEHLFGSSTIKISAQTYLLRFYGYFGFLPTGKEYLEDGIPHSEMVLAYDRT